MPLSTSWSVTVSAVLLLFFSPSLVLAKDVWQVHLRYGPAPAPSLRPPIARDATYDSAALAWQIPVLIGSYLLVVSLIGVSILTFGRRMRKDAQNTKGPKPVEMVRPTGKGFDTPGSRASTGSLWKKWGSPRMGSTKSANSPPAPSVVSFDPNVIQSDRAKRQEEMERIYDEIMGNDTKAPKDISVREREVSDDQSSTYYGHTRNLSASSRSFSRRHPPQTPEAQNFAYLLRSPSIQSPPLQTPSIISPQIQSPPITGGIQAVYPPYAPMPSDPNAATTTQPGYTGYGSQPGRVSGLPTSARPPRPASPQDPAQRPPPYSRSRSGSISSVKSKASYKSARKMQISNPIPVPTLQDEFEVKTPITPKFVKEVRPPTPPTAGGQRHTLIEDSEDSDDEKTSNRYARRRQPPNYQGDDSSDDEERRIDEDQITEGIIGSYQLRTPRPLPPTAPQRPQMGGEMERNMHAAASNISLAPSSAISRTNTPAAVSTTSLAKQGASSSTNTLPFRAIHPPIGSPPLLSPRAPGPTFLSPQRANFLPGGMHQVGPNGLVPNSAALLSAGLATPYSPYMPFSPMTPVTPHLMTRQERREAQRDRGRQMATQEDVVRDEKDMWGDGWD